MTFGQAISTCFSKYADGKGRATRSEFWYFCLFNLIVWRTVGALLGKTSDMFDKFGLFALVLVIGLPMVQIAVIIPNIAASVRRMHDIDKSGWFVLIPFYNLVLLATPGTVGPNRFDHKASDATTWTYPSLQNEAMTSFNGADPNQALAGTYVQTRKKTPLVLIGLIMLGLSPLVVFSPFILAGIGAQLFCEGGSAGANEANCGWAALPWAMIMTIPSGIVLAIAGIVVMIVGAARKQ